MPSTVAEVAKNDPAHRRERYFRRTRRAAWWLAGLFSLSAAVVWPDDPSFAQIVLGLSAVLFLWGIDAHQKLQKLLSNRESIA